MFCGSKLKYTGITFLLVAGLMAVSALAVTAQCVDDANGRTAVQFSNQSSYDLTFFVDEEEPGVFVPSGKESVIREVTAGEHMLRARGDVAGMFVWVWVVNAVPLGQLCTWTVEDPPSA